MGTLRELTPDLSHWTARHLDAEDPKPGSPADWPPLA